MSEDKEMREAWEKFRSSEDYIKADHFPECRYFKRDVPLDHCSCGERYVWQKCWQHRQGEIDGLEQRLEDEYGGGKQ